MIKIIFILIFQLLFSLAVNAGNLELVTVAKHVDGDTMHVRFKSGKISTIRFIGVDTPETKHPSKGVEYFGKEASAFTKKNLPLGKLIYLEKDVSETDRYGRLLRYVWLTKPKNSKSEYEIRKNMFNAILLTNGYAKQVTFPPDVQNSNLFKKFAKEARTNRKGLWK
jgi:Micrococcal nuclease (thermonuclease) homologs